MPPVWKTDNKARELVPFSDVPDKYQADFDYLKEDEHYDYRFVRYKGAWYDVYDTTRLDGHEFIADHGNWHSYADGSAWHCTVFRFPHSIGDTVVCGTYMDVSD